MIGSHDAYIHGTDPEEQSRLSRLNDVLNGPSLERLRIAPGSRILDVGCGLGQLTRMIGRAAGPSGSVLGIERSKEQIEQARRLGGAADDGGRVEVREGDALDLPLREKEWGTFDVAHARFLLEHVAHPQAVVDGMVRAVRPGGRIVLEDDDHDVLRAYPEPHGMEALWRAYIRTYAAMGLDPFVGRKLPSLLVAAGAVPTRTDWPFFGACHGWSAFETLVTNFLGIMRGARASIETHGGLDRSTIDATMRAIEAWSRTPGAALWYCTFWAEGTKSAD